MLLLLLFCLWRLIHFDHCNLRRQLLFLWFLEDVSLLIQEAFSVSIFSLVIGGEAQDLTSEELLANNSGFLDSPLLGFLLCVCFVEWKGTKIVWKLLCSPNAYNKLESWSLQICSGSINSAMSYLPCVGIYYINKTRTTVIPGDVERAGWSSRVQDSFESFESRWCSEPTVYPFLIEEFWSYGVFLHYCYCYITSGLWYLIRCFEGLTLCSFGLGMVLVCEPEWGLTSLPPVRGKQALKRSASPSYRNTCRFHILCWYQWHSKRFVWVALRLSSWIIPDFTLIYH